MRAWIIDTPRSLLGPPASPRSENSVTLEEIAACAGIPLSHLRAHYTSVAAIHADLQRLSTPDRQAPATMTRSS